MWIVTLLFSSMTGLIWQMATSSDYTVSRGTQAVRCIHHCYDIVCVAQVATKS